MKFSSQIKLAILTFLITLGLNIQPVYAENILDKFKKATRFATVKDKTVKKESEEIISRISSECCNKNFKERNQLLEIETFLKKCLDDKCYVALTNIQQSGKPKKLIAIQNIEIAKELLIQNQKLNLSKESEETENLISQLKEQKNLSKEQKEQLEKVNKSNEQLKDKIEKMLSNYDKRINELEKQIKILEEENSKLFSELPKYKQKKFKKD